MTGMELAKIGELLYGHHWKGEISHRWGYNKRRLLRMSQELEDIPPQLEEDLHAEAVDRLAQLQLWLEPDEAVA